MIRENEKSPRDLRGLSVPMPLEGPNSCIPQPGERFERRQLSFRTRQLAERVSGIWELPLQDLLPCRGDGRAELALGRRAILRGRDWDAEYDDFQHTISTFGKVGRHPTAIEHELGHSFTFLVNPVAYKRVAELDRLESGQLGVGFGGKVMAFGLGLKLQLRVLGRMMGGQMEEALADSCQTYPPRPAYRAVRAYCDRYWPDWALLMAADNRKDISSKAMADLELHYVLHGLLEPPAAGATGRLTQKGVEHVLKRMPRDRVVEKLRMMERHRLEADEA